jgi:MFS family permease
MEQVVNPTVYPKYRWFVLVVMFFACFAMAGLILIGPSPLVGEIAATTGWQLGTVTAIAMFSFTLFVAIGCVLGAFLLDKLDVNKVFLLACALSAVGCLLMSLLATSMLGMMFCRLLEGFGAGFIMASPAKIAGEWFPINERGIVTGVQGAGIGFGTAVGLNVTPALASSTGSWVTALTLSAIFPAIVFVLSLILFFGPKAPQHQVEKPVVKSRKGQSVFQLVLKQPVFYIAIIMTFCFSWVQQGYSDLTPGHLAVAAPTGLGLGAQAGGSIFSLYQLAFTFGALASGFIGRFLFKNNLKLAIGIGYALAAIFNTAVLLPAINSNITALMIDLILAGFFFSWCSAMTFAYLTQCYPVSVIGRVGGITQGLGVLGAPVGVAVGSIALNVTSRYTTAIVLCFVALAVSFVLNFLLNKPKCFADQVN